MQPLKLDLLIATFSYGGNGGIASEHPDVRKFLARVQRETWEDERIGRVMDLDKCDTPITMSRNAMVLAARKAKADLLLMVDSDQAPDLYPGEPGSKPFWKSSFDFLYKHYAKGPCCIGAPYCGPPPHPVNGGAENIYVFRWRSRWSNALDEHDVKLDQYTREEAFSMSGIDEAAALPTGLILFDMRIFDLTDPMPVYRRLREEGVPHAEAMARTQSWFDYEYEDVYRAQKLSTEDVFATRNLSLAGIQKYGYNPVFCNWDAWAGHWKPRCVGKPNLLTAEQVNERTYRAVDRGVRGDEKLRRLDFGIPPELLGRELATNGTP